MSFKSFQSAKRHLQNCPKNQSTEAFSEESGSDFKEESLEKTVVYQKTKLRK